MDLRSRIKESPLEWRSAPKELIELKSMLSAVGQDSELKPIELANNFLEQNDGRLSILRDILKKLYLSKGFWSVQSMEDDFSKCLLACKKLGIEVTREILEGKCSMEENYEFWKTILTAKPINILFDPKMGLVEPTNTGESSEYEDDQNQKYRSDAYDSDEGRKLEKKDSWQTNSFTELPDMFGDHINFDEDGNMSLPRNLGGVSAIKSDSPTYPETRESILGRYDKTRSIDEATQAGIASWDWLRRLEQMLIQFFLIIFDSTADSSKLMMEVMPPEASVQIDEIFQLLLQAEPDMYENLGYIVGLAEQWLIHWKGDAQKKSKALEFVKLYMLGIKDENYYNIPVERRLRKLGSFIAGLKLMGNQGSISKIEWGKPNKITNFLLPFDLEPIEPLNKIKKKRPPSPRVVPGTHFARVVANILCNHPCSKPMDHLSIYADKIAKKSFDTPFHDDQHFKTYVHQKYGNNYTKQDVFTPIGLQAKNVLQDQLKSLGMTSGKISIENKHCWLPIYTRAYQNKIKEGKCCGHNDEDTYRNIIDKDGNTGSWAIGLDGRPYRRKKSRPSEDEEDEDDTFTDRKKRYKSLGRNRKSKSRQSVNKESSLNNKKQNKYPKSYRYSDMMRKGMKIKRTYGHRSEPGDPDYLSDDEWFHDKTGNRIRRKKPLQGGQRPRPGDLDYDSDKEWYHDKNGKSVKRKQPLIPGQRPRPGDLDYDSDKEWHHDNQGKRVMSKHPFQYEYKSKHGDLDYDSDDEWIRDKNGKRLMRKKPLPPGHRPRPGDLDYNSNDEWIHDKKGKRVKRKQPLQGGQRPRPGDLDYDSDDEWYHDKNGKRIKSKYPLNITPAPRPQPGDSDYDTDDEWIHDKNGKRIKRKQPLQGGHRSRPGDLDYKSDDEWIHDKDGKRVKRKRPLQGGQRPEPGDLDYDSDEQWYHDKNGARIGKKKKENGNNPANEAGGDFKKKKSLQKKRLTMDNDVIVGHVERKTKSKFDPPSMKKKSHLQKEEDLALEASTRYHGGTGNRPSWITNVDSKFEGIKIKGLNRSLADLDEQLRKVRMRTHSDTAIGGGLIINDNKSGKGMYNQGNLNIKDQGDMNGFIWPKLQGVDPLTFRNQLLYLDGYIDKEELGEDGLMNIGALENIMNNKETMNIPCNGQLVNVSKQGDKLKCPESLWGALPLPKSELMPNGNAVICKEGGSLPVPIQSRNVLKEDTFGGLDAYSLIPGFVSKYSQMFRDQARTKGFSRPSTAEITSTMIQRTAQIIKRKNLEKIDNENKLGRSFSHNGFKKSRGKKFGVQATRSEGAGMNNSKMKKRVRRYTDPTKRVPLARSLFELLKKEEFASEESEMELDENGVPILTKPIRKKFGPFKTLHPGVWDETAKRFHGVTSGPFIPRIDRRQQNRISFSLASSPTNGTRKAVQVKKASLKYPVSPTEEGDILFDIDEEEEEDAKLPSLAVREKLPSRSSLLKKSFEKYSPIKSDTPDQGDEYSDKLLFPTNNNQLGNQFGSFSKDGKGKTSKLSGTLESGKHKLSHLEEKVTATLYSLHGKGQGDHLDTRSFNPCWEMASKMFKTPLRAPAIPLPENLVIHIEKKFPKLQWPRGIPVSMRYYPSGNPFCIVFNNGSGRVHYPHGGLAVLISAPAPKYSRILVIRDPFDRFYFFDKAVMADINCKGKGEVYEENGSIKVQYNLHGGYRQDSPAQRWQWNRGGQRMVMKLNRYMALRILDVNKIYLGFYGNKRGFRINLGAGQQVNLMSATCDSSKLLPPYKGGLTNCGGFDYIRGRFSTPVFGYFDKAIRQRPSNEKCTVNNDKSNCGGFRGTLSDCVLEEQKDQCNIQDCFV